MKPLQEKMLEAIFVKTGGRPENPVIAKICADIAIIEMEAIGLGLGNKDNSLETKTHSRL